MNEAIENLDSVLPGDIRNENTVLLDTSFLVYELKRNPRALSEFCKDNFVLITDFNLSELESLGRHDHGIKRLAKKFLEKNLVKTLLTKIVIGDWEGEKQYASSTDTDLLKHVYDPSDAVLVAAAIRSRSDVLTRDKHHLFTAELENKLSEYNIKIFNDITSFQEYA